ncbi:MULTISPECIES: hypothetical protein [Burkholderia]|uniref:hypothetical protein n=1 Tax=Burkholderia TaxID=32008 RepID=UPI0005E75864|nr:MULTISPECIES: hypothetical protein [Burkholderia]AYX07981.1 hypothetical protein EGY14_31105 [Burkholderia pseudomallei]KVQ18226.1 hypothetical protein WJ98_19585 [Burkholderia ubonensis]KWI93741.1 hypothetical protein WM09_00320 [Burkholderia ubonensis]OMR50247.1 hypothetical protein AQ725_29920 [Burkholderia pseudomallei]CAJ6220440.1 Uncharacterised protein [Burkholderia pseudomallei]
MFPLDHIVEIGVDKLKCCVRTEQVDVALATFLQKQFDSIENKPGTKKLSSQRKAFQKRLQVPVGGNLVLIECQPNTATHPWAVTIEFNPNQYLRKGEKAIVHLGSFFRFLFGLDARRVLSHVVVTTLHVNIDYNINPLEGTLVDAKGKRSGAKVLYDFGGQGVLGSLYVGALGSDRRICIYDKAAEVLHRELAPHANKILATLASDRWDIKVSKLHEKLANANHWRLEVRCEPKDAVPISKIASFASCFDGIRLLHLPPDVRPFNTSLGRLFVASARSDGVPVALQALDENERRQFNRAINRLPDIEWFNSELLSEAIGQVIAKLAPLFAPPHRRLEEVRTGNHHPHAASTADLAAGAKFRRTVHDLAKPRAKRVPIVSGRAGGRSAPIALETDGKSRDH